MKVSNLLVLSLNLLVTSNIETGNISFVAMKRELSEGIMQELKRAHDPSLKANPQRFERLPLNEYVGIPSGN